MGGYRWRRRGRHGRRAWTDRPDQVPLSSTGRRVAELFAVPASASEMCGTEDSVAISAGIASSLGANTADVELTRLRRVRWRLGFPVAATAFLLLTGLAGLLWMFLGRDAAETNLRDGGPPAAAEIAVPAARPSVGREQLPDGSASSAAVLIIHVAGAVRRPGIVNLPAGSRVYQAIEAVGGALPTAAPDTLNLAAEVRDGEHLVVPTTDEATSGEGGYRSAPKEQRRDGARQTAGENTADKQKVNLNTATAKELATLPRIGPALAQRIVDWRERFGRFGSAEQLESVTGIGPKLREALAPWITW